MPDVDPRVQCPQCDLRVRVPAARVPEGASLSARCRGCGASYEVRHRQGVFEVRAEDPPAPTKSSAAPAPAPVAAAAETEALPEGFQVGDRLGRYEIEGLAGRGGMGTVYQAFDPSSNRHVAVKVLRRDATDLDRVRFEREIAVQANIRHPYIMPIFDAGTAGETRFYAMELLHEPVDLMQLAEGIQTGAYDKGPLRKVSTLLGVIEHVVLPLCKAVQHANVDEGVLHRDIKPINVMLDGRNLRPYLIDFGVSSLLDPRNPRMAKIDEDYPMPLRGEGVFVTGTLIFMPPEQARGEADPRGDVWGLGALLQFLVTGHAPYAEAVRPSISREERLTNLEMLLEDARRAGNRKEVAEYEQMIGAMHTGAERTVKDLRRDVLRGRYLPRPPDLDARLDEIIAKALAAKADQRYAHAGLMHDALADWVQHQRHPQSASRGAARTGGSRPLWKHPAVVGGAAAIALGAGALAFWPKSEGPDAARVAAEHVARAEALEQAGKWNEARAVVREALAADPRSDAALGLWDRLARREGLRADLKRVRELVEQARDTQLSVRERDRLRGAAHDLAQRVKARADEADDLSALDLDKPIWDDLLLSRSLFVQDAPHGSTMTLWAWDDTRGVAWARPRSGIGNVEVVLPGRYVLGIRRKDRDVFVPFDVAEEDVTVHCPVDPARVPEGMVYVAGGTFVGPDGATVVVGPLLWERHEVTVARYAAFLASLDASDRRARVPRLVGDLGEHGAPLWSASGETYETPAGALRMPVENVSQYDAKAFAAHAGRRLPTEVEWMWAASGPFAPATPVGAFPQVRARAHLDRGVAGAAGVMETRDDRNAFGLFDMAGNLAEFTSTLAHRDDDTGWVVKGGSYAWGAPQALVHARRLVPGWLPQSGVGMRLVADLSALAPPPAPPPAADDTQK